MPSREANDDQQPQMTSISAHQQMLASCTGAVLTSLTMTPFDVVKNRLQAQNQPQVRNCTTTAMGSAAAQTPVHCPGCGTPHAPRIRFHGTMDAFFKIGRHEGLRSLWRGMTPTLMMSVPGTVVYFSLYDQLRPHLGDSKYSPGACGGISRIFAATVVSPLEMLRTKMQATQNAQYAEAFRAIRATVRADGLQSLYRGLGSTLLRDVPFSAAVAPGHPVLPLHV
ncbi:hypothetical protein PTSG_08866 [Salpingoeca rosetta]|uniref:Uncharacterized protein n=1 Tax=Salpingoeca rosetta (strain ATCC 50818 / BSB-021) TaxID=946362 RepID=F2UKX7_SALR5|nr:uncharacterized protein PTSG_08866 [Salpingoeca rosetta]EGD77776.1 hypothetical protein PTSG_08866 [Salpingoeca rosetta]|eukprot:XP_004990252.1 hypothetical protein PTSG_08866 [Salpingoeca rosetta]